MFSSPIWISGWILIALSRHWSTLILGRLLTGISAGTSLPSAQIYVSECSNPKIRGVIGSFPSVAMSLGVLFSYIFGKFFAWNILAWISCSFNVISFLTLYFLPDSPVWLKSKGRLEEALHSKNWLRLEGLSLEVDDESENSSKGKNICMSRAVLMPLGIGLALLAIQQLSGIDAIIFFTVEIFKTAGSSIDSHLATIIVGIVQVVFNILSLFLVDKTGRKPLLIASGIIMSISTTSMGGAYYLNSIGNQSFGLVKFIEISFFLLFYEFFQIPSNNQSYSIHDWLFNWVWLYTVFTIGRNLSSEAKRTFKLNWWII